MEDVGLVCMSRNRAKQRVSAPRVAVGWGGTVVVAVLSKGKSSSIMDAISRRINNRRGDENHQIRLLAVGILARKNLPKSGKSPSTGTLSFILAMFSEINPPNMMVWPSQTLTLVTTWRTR